MATYFLAINLSKPDCTWASDNYNICVDHNFAGFKNKDPYKEGDTVFLLIKQDKSWILKAKSILEPTTAKSPWSNRDYNAFFKAKWKIITNGGHHITPNLEHAIKGTPLSNYGLLLQPGKDLETSIGNNGIILINDLNKFFE